jgi:hypothetical protein
MRVLKEARRNIEEIKMKRAQEMRQSERRQTNK